MTTPTRDYLVELADAVRELTEPRKSETRHEVRVQNKRGHWKRVRKTHRVELPCLLDSLAEAIEPASDGEALLANSFNSQPSADIAAIAATARIRSEALEWASELHVPVKPLKVLLPALISAATTAGKVKPLSNAAKSWARTARLATGFDEPFMPDIPCPYCAKSHSLVADLDPKDETRKVFCRNCKVDWDESTIGLLSDMLLANQTRTTMTEAGPCPDFPDCQARGGHVRHYDSRGRYWPLEGLGDTLTA